VKNLITRMMFGGSYGAWFIEENHKVPDCKFLKELKEVTEMSTGYFAPICFPNYKKFQAIARKKHMEPPPENEELPLPLDEGAIARTAFSLYLQDKVRGKSSSI
jgi:hypothetical protein